MKEIKAAVMVTASEVLAATIEMTKLATERKAEMIVTIFSRSVRPSHHTKDISTLLFRG
jgi:hypothetical protein